MRFGVPGLPGDHVACPRGGLPHPAKPGAEQRAPEGAEEGNPRLEERSLMARHVIPRGSATRLRGALPGARLCPAGGRSVRLPTGSTGAHEEGGGERGDGAGGARAGWWHPAILSAAEIATPAPDPAGILRPPE